MPAKSSSRRKAAAPGRKKTAARAGAAKKTATAKKPAAKKSAVKKSAAKKSTAKKSAAKKSTAKKVSAKKVVSAAKRTARKASKRVHQGAARAREVAGAMTVAGQIVAKAADVIDSIVDGGKKPRKGSKASKPADK
jgi:hypothetical protein